jgi:hypothetical protein
MTTTQTTHDCPPDTLYVKKAIPVSCIQWDGKLFDMEAPNWVHEALLSGTLKVDGPLLKVKMRENAFDTAWPKDWIIRGIDGAVYCCPLKVFKLSYEPFQPTVRDGVSVQDFQPAGQSCPICFAPVGAR